MYKVLENKKEYYIMDDDFEVLPVAISTKSGPGFNTTYVIYALVALLVVILIVCVSYYFFKDPKPKIKKNTTKHEQIVSNIKKDELNKYAELDEDEDNIEPSDESDETPEPDSPERKPDDIPVVKKITKKETPKPGTIEEIDDIDE